MQQRRLKIRIVCVFSGTADPSETNDLENVRVYKTTRHVLNGIRTAGVFTGAFTARFTIKRVLKSTCQPTQYTTIYNILRCVCRVSPPHPRLLHRTVMVFYYLLFFRVFILGRSRIISPQHCGRRTLVFIRAYVVIAGQQVL